MMRLGLVAAICLTHTSVQGFVPSSAPSLGRGLSRTPGALSLQCQDLGEGKAPLGRRKLLQAGLLGVALAPSVVHADLFGGDSKVGWGEAQKAGVQWGGGFANPLTSQSDDFRAELVNGNGTPIIINFQKPSKWKISTNVGIAIQDYITSDSAYVLVAPNAPGVSSLKDIDSKYPLDKVFDIRGRYGTFGKVDAITVTKKKVEKEGTNEFLYIDFKFTTLSPGGREIDRTGCLKIALVDGDLVMLVASSNSNRWKKVQEEIAQTVTSYSAAAAPKTSLKSSSVDSEIGNMQALGIAGYDLLRYDSPVW
eukprot:CAMPEP_0206242000 /NCGR_PEP_ID=MMETSP0047_2-20121206/16815_1 /ASSEMBLY_ACC=CAM_ASM_000192 /TAXON_ID=195065 /ORGANISM="Chroomonas mesostigmatica_cf, Strain CCMP1168" /LENGTH=307 /DNA_ID=CAMNT_0053666973 /DNA_START=23 /DNA_END=943 /DNA_ORIENTATION=-